MNDIPLGKRSAIPTLLTAGFRFYFTMAGIYAPIAIGAWMFWLQVHATGAAFVHPLFSMAPHHWHAHEMIYGYAAAVLAGFFLTALPNWTGERPRARPISPRLEASGWRGDWRYGFPAGCRHCWSPLSISRSYPSSARRSPAISCAKCRRAISSFWVLSRCCLWAIRGCILHGPIFQASMRAPGCVSASWCSPP